MLQVGDLGAVLRLDRSQFDRGLSEAGTKFEGWGSTIQSKAAGIGSAIGGALKTGLTVATGVAVAGATLGLKNYMDLESAAGSAASKAVDVSGKSTEEIKAQYDSLQKHIMDVSRDLGGSTVFAPLGVAQAYDALAGAGKDIANIGRNELLPFLDLATTDMKYGLGNTVSLTTATMNSFGYSMQDSRTLADMYTKAVNGTDAALSDFEYALKQSGSTAAALKMPFNDYLAIIGKLKDRTYQGEMAGSALKTAMLSLMTPTKDQTEALAELGLTFDEVNPATHNFIDVLKLLRDRGADVGDFARIFTNSSGAVMFAASEEADSIKKLSASISDSDGLSRTVAGLVMDTEKLVGAWEQAKGGAEELYTAIGSFLEPAAVKLLNTWSDLVPKLVEFGDAIARGDWPKVGSMIADGISVGWEKLKDLGSEVITILSSVDWKEVGGHIVSGIIGIGTDIARTIYDEISKFDFSGALSGLGKAFEELPDWAKFAAGVAVAAGAILTVSAAVTALGGIIGGLTAIAVPVIAAVTAALATLSAPLAVAVIAAGALAAVFVDWSAVGAAAGEAISRLVDFVGNLAGLLGEGNWGGAFDLLKTSAAGVSKDVVDYFKKLDIKGAISGAAKKAGGAWDTIKTTAQTAATKAKEFFSGLDIQGAISGAIGKASDVWGTITSAVSGVVTEIQGMLGNIRWGDLGFTLATTVRNAIKSLDDIGTQVAGYITEAIGKLGNAKEISGAAENIGKTFLSSLQNLGQDLATNIKTGLETLNSWWEQFKTGWNAVDFSSVGTGIAEKIKTGLQNAASTLVEVGSAWGEQIKSGLAQVTGWAVDIIENLKKDFQKWIDSNGPKDLGEKLGMAVAEGAAKLGTWIADKLREKVAWAEDIGKQILDGIKSYWDKRSDASSLAKSIGDGLKYIFGTLINFTGMAGKAAWDFVKGFAGGIVTYGKGTIGAAILDLIASVIDKFVEKAPSLSKYLGIADAAEDIRGLAKEWRDAIPERQEVEVTADIDANWNGTDPSSIHGKTFDSTMNVRTNYVDTSGNPIDPLTGFGFTNARGYNIPTFVLKGTDYQYQYEGEKVTEQDLVKILAAKGYTWQDVRDYLISSEAARLTASKAEGRGGEAQHFTESRLAGLEGIYEANKKAIADQTTATEEVKETLNLADKILDVFQSEMDLTLDALSGITTSIDNAAGAIKESAQAQYKMSQAASNALKIGGEVGGKLLGEGCNAVRIGLDASGREIAIIGRVAQENFVKAGGTFTDGIQTSTTRASGAIQVGAQRAASEATGAATTAGNTAKTAAATAGITTTTNAQKAANSINSGADQARAKIAAAGDVGTKLTIGAQYAASAIVSAGSSFAAAVRGAASMFSNASYFRNPFENPQYKTSWRATGTKTSGPELAVIGEDGPSWPEFVIPTKTKRWDLLAAAMQAYGIPGYAEGTATGPVPSGSDTAGFSGSITISIGKLAASVAKTLSQIINSFRTSWAVIKADTSKHWLALIANTATEMGQFRDVVTTSVSETRTAVISNWRALATDGLTIWTEGGAAIRQQAAYLADQIKMSADNTRIAVQDLWNATKDELNNGIMELQTVWQTGWQKMDADLAAASANIKSKVQEIAALLKSISGASVNISVGGFIGGGGGGSGGGGGGGGSAADQFINQYFGDTTCQIDELSGMSPGLIQSLIQSGAWSPNNSALSQKIAQAYGYGTSAAQVLGGAGMAAAKGIAGGIGAALTGGSIGDSTYVTRQGQLVGGTVGTGYASQSSSWGSMASQAARGSSGVYKIGKYDAGGISAQPQLAIVSGQGEPELHLTKSNVREFLGDGGDRPMIIQVFLGDREVTDLVMKKAISKARTKGLILG